MVHNDGINGTKEHTDERHGDCVSYERGYKPDDELQAMTGSTSVSSGGGGVD